ncbi:MAG: prolipoprotein diacylglyceryl transferase [Lachnospiraceae bacterium]|nr:prolipoprotein diacylglyceryl transferase [Lachnospiraceae bacterium]
MDIAFPNLGIYLKDVPKSFSVFGFEIAYYGLIIGVGVLLGILLAVHMAKVTGQNQEVYWDFAVYAVIFSIIGARIYYVVFQWDAYKDDLLSVFNIRQGGMAIYGAVIGAVITLLIYCRIKKQNPFRMADTGAYGLILGQIIGRWGNFINREVFGGYSDGLFAMRIPEAAVRDKSDITQDIASHMTEGTNYIQVQPTFLYESLWNVMILAIMFLYRKRQKFYGEVCLIYFGGYGLGRFIIEGIRTDRLLIPGTQIAVSQLIGILCFVGAILADIIVRVRIRKGLNIGGMSMEKDACGEATECQSTEEK